MKSLLFTITAFTIFTGISLPGLAQTNINLEKLSGRTNAPKFIDGIELQPAASAGTTAVAVTEVKPAKTIVKPAAGNNATIEKCQSIQFKYALLTDTEVEAISNLSLYSFIEDWWGTRYRYGGSTRDGIDCSAFAGRLMLDVFKLGLPRTARDQYQACYKLAKTDLTEGDLVFFNTTGGVSHVGVYLANGYFVHSSVSTGVVISSLEEPYYNKKFICGGRVKVD